MVAVEKNNISEKSNLLGCKTLHPKEGYKQTELGLIPVDWEIKKIGEVCACIVPARNKPKEFNGSIPWITTPDIKNNKVSISINNLYVSKEEINKCGNKIVPKNSIIMTCVGELGLVALVENDIVMNQQLHAFLPSSKIDSKYLLNILITKKDYMEMISTKTAVPYMNKTSCNSIPIELPPIEEQKKISTILTTWDNAIEKTEKLIKTKTKLKKALMQQLLTGKRRFKEFIKSNEYKQTELGLIPVDWEIKKLEDVSDIKGGKRLPKGRNLMNTKTPFPYIRVSDMYMGGIDTSNILYIPEDVQPSIKQYTISKNDLFISVAGTLGLVGKIPSFLNGANLTENADKITNISIDKDFLLYILISDYIQNEISDNSTNNAQPKLALSRIRDFLITIPPIEEQKKIASVLTSCDKEIELLEKKLETLKNQKKGLMQKLLTGQIRVKIDI